MKAVYDIDDGYNCESNPHHTVREKIGACHL